MMFGCRVSEGGLEKNTPVFLSCAAVVFKCRVFGEILSTVTSYLECFIKMIAYRLFRDTQEIYPKLCIYNVARQR